MKQKTKTQSTRPSRRADIASPEAGTMQESFNEIRQQIKHWSKQRGEKIRATRIAKREKFNTQTIEIDQGWRIIRFDEMNWQIQFKGKPKGFFGTLRGAFRALPDKMLHETAKNSIAEILGSWQGVCERIDKVLAKYE